MKRKILIGVLTFVMVFATALVTASADGDGDATITWGTKELVAGNDSSTGHPASYVYYGSYPQSLVGETELPGVSNPEDGKTYTYNGNSYYYMETLSSNFISDTGYSAYHYFLVEPISWVVLSRTPTGKVPGSASKYTDDEYAALSDWSAEDGLFLISSSGIDRQQYHTDQENKDPDNADKLPLTYGVSTLRSWLNGYGASSNTGDTGSDKDADAGIDYSADGNNFLSRAFTSKEKSELIPTVLENPDYSDNLTVGSITVPYTNDGGYHTKDTILTASVSDWDAMGGIFPRSTMTTWYSAAGGTAREDQSTMSWQHWWLRNIGQTASYSSSGETITPSLYPNYAAEAFGENYYSSKDVSGGGWQLTLIPYVPL